MTPYEKLINSKRIQNFLNQLSSRKQITFKAFLENRFESDVKSPKRVKCFFDIVKNNDDNHMEKYLEYCKNPNTIAAKEIRHGQEYAESYRQKLLNRPKVDRSEQNKYDPSFIAKTRGITESEAQIIIDGWKKDTSEKSREMHRKRKQNGYDYRANNPLCLEYWLARNENNEDAHRLYKKYIEKTRTNRNGFALRHGEEVADNMYDVWVERRRNTWIRKYGVSTPMFGKASKESLGCLIPLYKKVRRLGIDKQDVYWGIEGSREYAHHSTEMGNFFFDFTVKSLKYIVEYNGSMWHSHPDWEYTGFLDEDKIIERDYQKKRVMEDKGYIIRYIWDFENHEKRIDQIVNEMKGMI